MVGALTQRRRAHAKRLKRVMARAGPSGQVAEGAARGRAAKKPLSARAGAGTG
jgi:hypothetical protein